MADSRKSTLRWPARPFSLPALLLGVTLAVLFFKVYGWFTRPDVPKPIQTVLQQFAPGVRLGDYVASVRKRVPTKLTWVSGLGYIGTLHSPGPAGTESFQQVRLLLEDSDTRKNNPEDARIQAVEFITAEPGAFTSFASDLTTVFQTVPREGCVALGEEGNYREVRYWTTPSDRGGVVLMNNFGGNRSTEHPGMVLVSFLVYTGKFDGSRTVRATYVPQSCNDASRASVSGDISPSESANSAFAELAAAVLARGADSGSPSDTLVACEDRVLENGWRVSATNMVAITLPTDYAPVDLARRDSTARANGYPYYDWRAPDNSTITISAGGSYDPHSGWSGLRTNHCDISAAGARVHVDVGHNSREYGDRLVHAIFVFPDKNLPLEFEGKARTLARQAEMLHAVRTIAIMPTWGRAY